MAYAEDRDGFADVLEADAVVTETEAKLGWRDSLQPFHIAFFGGDKAGEAMQQIDGGVAVDGANVGTGLFGPSDLLGHALSQRS
jgi:hypothetical protein